MSKRISTVSQIIKISHKLNNTNFKHCTGVRALKNRFWKQGSYKNRMVVIPWLRKCVLVHIVRSLKILINVQNISAKMKQELQCYSLKKKKPNRQLAIFCRNESWEMKWEFFFFLTGIWSRVRIKMFLKPKFIVLFKNKSSVDKFI